MTKKRNQNGKMESEWQKGISPPVRGIIKTAPVEAGLLKPFSAPPVLLPSESGVRKPPLYGNLPIKHTNILIIF